MDQPPELVVHDELQPCPYLEGRLSRLPLRIPARSLSRDELEVRLSRGDRRQGLFLYRPACPGCVACEPIRLDLQSFRPNRSQRRTLARGDRELTLELGEPVADLERVALYNRHKALRGLSAGQGEVDVRSYREFLAMTCCDTLELRYRLGGKLVGVAIADRSDEALSAVYCYYDPSYERLGLGTYSILKQLELCQSWGLRYLYLGLYIAESLHMRYKARFLPHQRLLDGAWQEVTQP
ncbi:MAG: arginyltransferase [Myxococcales bacterium]|nr:MAG: arginyltransferase [Myxococcales bacterium]